MSEELDRRIAEGVFGELEPLPPTIEQDTGEQSAGGNWVIEKAMPGYRAGVWKPLSFSSSLDLATRAVDKFLLDIFLTDSLWLSLSYYAPAKEWMADFAYMFNEPYLEEAGNSLGSSAPEAICRLLLKLKEVFGNA